MTPDPAVTQSFIAYGLLGLVIALYAAIRTWRDKEKTATVVGCSISIFLLWPFVLLFLLCEAVGGAFRRIDRWRGIR